MKRGITILITLVVTIQSVTALTPFVLDDDEKFISQSINNEYVQIQTVLDTYLWRMGFENEQDLHYTLGFTPQVSGFVHESDLDKIQDTQPCIQHFEKVVQNHIYVYSVGKCSKTN